MTLWSRLAAIGLTVAATAGSAYAASPATRTIEVPAGAVVLVLPGAGMPMMEPGMLATDDGFADPFAMLRRVNQMMQQRFANPAQDGLIEAAMRQMQSGDAMPGMTGMMVTTVSNGRGSCTRQVVYSGDRAAPKVDVKMTGDACGSDGLPAALPSVPQAVPARAPVARTWEAARHRPTAIQVAQLGN